MIRSVSTKDRPIAFARRTPSVLLPDEGSPISVIAIFLPIIILFITV